MRQAPTVLPVLRRSAMQTAKSCLFRYKRIWIDGVPDSNDYSLKGIAFHSCAHRYIARLVSHGTPADHDEAKAAFVEGIAAALTPPNLVPEVRAIFFQWAEHFELDIEWFLAAEEHQIGKSQHTFTPDLVYARPNGLEIVDFKTYWRPLSEEQIRADFQALFYVYYAQRIWPNFQKYTFTHSYVRFGTQVSVEFTAADFDGFADSVEAVAATEEEAQARNEWPATAGPECAYCTLDCPIADNEALMPVRMPLPQQAQAVGAWLVANTRKATAGLKALKAYVSAYGPVTVGGVEWNNRPVTQRLYPIGDVLRILKERNVMGAFDGEAGLTISHSALAKLIKQFPQLAADLLPFQQTKTTYRFSAQAPGDDEDGEA